jgi:hypothetical protein
MPFVPPKPDPAKLLGAWMDWEKGETLPGRTLANLKTAGMKDLLEALVDAALADAASGDAPTDA